MSRRELVVLGTASQVPTRTRNHNGYILFWDGEAILFDPGEGTQRQMLKAGISATDITRIAITHLHGDHSLGLAGVIQRISLDRVPHTIPIYFPASGYPWIEHLRDATVFYDQANLELVPISAPGQLRGPEAPFTLSAAALDHGIDTFGYRLDEPDGRTFNTDLLADAGIFGPDIGLLQRAGHFDLDDGTRILADDVSSPRRGMSMAFVMDTRECPGAAQLAKGVDLLLIESTFLNTDRELADAHGHLTAIQAATIAAEAAVKTLVLTHFSQRYPDPSLFHDEARLVYDGELIIASDLDRIPVRR